MTQIPADFGQTWLNSDDGSGLLPPLPRRLAVGWSGGADSTALLLALHAAGHQVSAWHIDHAWRPESRQQADALERQAEVWGIPFFRDRLSVPANTNREAEARRERYRQFEIWAEEQQIDCLCLGHHRNDQAETVCMRLLQGAGPVGCQGMMMERHMGILRIVRPLLQVSGDELRQALTRAGVSWLEDPSNRDTRFRRNFIRYRLFPAIRQAGISPEDIFLRWGQQAERVAERLEHEARTVLTENAGSVASQSRVSVLWQDWAQVSAPVRARVLQNMMRQLLGDGTTPGRRHIQLAEIWTHQSARGGLDLSHCRLHRVKRFLHLDIAQADSRAK